MSTARLFLCKRLAAISAMIDEHESNYITSKRIDVNEYIALVQTSIRLSNTLGLNRRAKKIPDLKDYIARNYPQQTYHTHNDVDDDDDNDAPRGRVRRTRHTIDGDDEADDD